MSKKYAYKNYEFDFEKLHMLESKSISEYWSYISKWRDMGRRWRKQVW
jgi:hypothetical protein